MNERTTTAVSADAPAAGSTSMNPFAALMAPAGDGPVSAAARTDMGRGVTEVMSGLLLARSAPRDQVRAMDRILNACTRPSLAAGALYAYSRGGQDITGPSIRLAEAMAQCWGNLSFGIRELEQRPGESVVQAYCWDMETNVRREVTFAVPHVRETKGGGSKPVSGPRDVYEVVANLGARRVRACILAVIPGDVTEAAVAQCDLTLRSKADVSPEGIAKLAQSFAVYGVTPEHIEARIQRRLDSIQPAQVVQLRKVWASLRDGMSEPGDWFDIAPAGEAGGAGTGGGAPTPPADPGAKLKAAVKRQAGAGARGAGGTPPTPPATATGAPPAPPAAPAADAPPPPAGGGAEPAGPAVAAIRRMAQATAQGQEAGGPPEDGSDAPSFGDLADPDARG